MNFINENPRRAMIYGGALALIIISVVLSIVGFVPRPHVSIAAEPIFERGYPWLTNGVLTTLVIDVLLILIAYFATRKMNLVPSGLQNFMEAVIEYLYGLAEGVSGKAASTYFPWAATIFLFVVLSNWSGLIPGVGSIGFFHAEEYVVEEHGALADQQIAMVDGNLLLVQTADVAAQEDAEHGEEVIGEEGGHEKFIPLFRAPSADLNMTLALALATMVMVQIHGIRALGGSYFHKFWNTSGHGAMKGINIFVSLLEIVSEFSRIIAFTFRLFGNIFAGEVVLATMAFLVAFIIPIPFYLLEILVGAV